VAPREKRRGLTSVATNNLALPRDGGASNRINPIAGVRPCRARVSSPVCCCPFAAGYYLSYLFRTINALIAGDLTSELGLSAVDLGFLTSVYFLVFAAVQLPLGALLDRHGPRIIQSALLVVASVGALVFALADGLVGLVIGRALLGLGVALALMAGFKAIVLWFPPQRLALANGWLVMLGALGAVTATAPAELVVQAIGWRGLFAVLAGLSALAALLVLICVPGAGPSSTVRPASAVGVLATYRDPRFWRIAPLSSIGIGTSWSLQGLWAAPWLRDVDGLDRTAVVRHLTVMAVAVCVSALLLGVVADRLGRRVKTELVLVSTLGVSMTAQAGVLLQLPLPSYLLWGAIAAAGAATVLSFAILTEYFPKENSGRANAALNLLHVGGAFVLQSATGLVIEVWPEVHGTYPAEAHQAGIALSLLLQLAALAWFAWSPRRLPAPTMARATSRSVAVANTWRGDSDESLCKCSVGVGTACGARPQTRTELATCRQRIGDALHRSGGGAFPDDQSSGSGYPHLRDRPLASHSS
jgi:MFS family permease